MNDSAAQQIHIKLRAMVFGALVALGKEDGRAGKKLRRDFSLACWCELNPRSGSVQPHIKCAEDKKVL